jgi:superfamily I DNA/RNA helicase
VIVPDASPGTYPDTPEARRALYVAVTRTRQQLVLGAVAGQTPLLGLPRVGAWLAPAYHRPYFERA